MSPDIRVCRRESRRGEGRGGEREERGRKETKNVTVEGSCGGCDRTNADKTRRGPTG